MDVSPVEPRVARNASDALAGTTVDPAELLDVEVHQLAGAGALVTDRLVLAEATQAAHPDPSQDPRHRLIGHPQHLSDLGASHPQPPQRSDRLDPIIRRAVMHPQGSRGS